MSLSCTLDSSVANHAPALRHPTHDNQAHREQQGIKLSKNEAHVIIHSDWSTSLGEQARLAIRDARDFYGVPLQFNGHSHLVRHEVVEQLKDALNHNDSQGARLLLNGLHGVSRKASADHPKVSINSQAGIPQIPARLTGDLLAEQRNLAKQDQDGSSITPQHPASNRVLEFNRPALV